MENQNTENLAVRKLTVKQYMDEFNIKAQKTVYRYMDEGKVEFIDLNQGKTARRNIRIIVRDQPMQAAA